MYKHYIKIDENNYVTDSFSSWQIEKFDDSEIFIKDSIERHYVFDLYNEFGKLKLKYTAGEFQEATSEEIINDNIDDYKIEKEQELKIIIKDNLIFIDKSLDEIRIKWENFKSNILNLTTKDTVDTVFNQAVSWLEL